MTMLWGDDFNLMPNEIMLNNIEKDTYIQLQNWNVIGVLHIKEQFIALSFKKYLKI